MKSRRRLALALLATLATVATLASVATATPATCHARDVASRAARGAGASVAAAPPPAPADAPARAIAVGPVGITVADLDRSIDFYTRVLGFVLENEVELAGAPFDALLGVRKPRIRVAALRLGDETLLLTDYATPRGRPFPHDARANDHDFQHVAIVVRDMARAYARLREHGVEHASAAPQRLPDWNPAAGGIEAFYFRDPDGHFLELISFPPGKGEARWHRPGRGLFLGIDHTAIVVHDTERSLAFYRGLLGMRVAGESENWGIEQEHLNGVPGARLRITTLRAPHGPGIELLEYLTSRDGRPAPADARANDLAHWQTRITVADPGRAAAALREADVRLVSRGVVELPDDALGFDRGFLARDPDGHALEITAR